MITSITGLPTDPDTLWITSQGGLVVRYSISRNTYASAPLLTLPVAAGIESGLLGLAFHPGFASNNLLYLYHNIPGGGSANVVSEFRFDPAAGVILPASERRIIVLGRPGIHNGGWIGFGPDGMLHIAVGENGGQDNAQDTTANLLGKILRLDITRDDFPADPNRNYGIPADNPFVASASDDEILHFGLRNPWRCSFDRETGDLWIGDVGSGTAGEIDHLPADASGLNLGWPCFEGFERRSSSGACANVQNTNPPVLSFRREFSTVATTGGYVYRGAALPRLRGTYIFSDYIAPLLFTPSAGFVRAAGRAHSGITTFGESVAGELYAGARDGSIYAIVCAADFNADDFLDFFDYADFVQAFTSGPGLRADLNADGFVDVFDYMAFVEDFEQGC